MDWFDISGMQKQMEESKERWKKIDFLVKELERVEKDERDRNAVILDLRDLLLLLVEQMRPAYSPEALEKGMKEVYDAFMGGYKDGK